MTLPRSFRLLLLAAVSSLALTACGDDDAPPPVAETRAHDSRTFAVIPAQANATTFAAVTGGSATTDASLRWAGVLGGAAYQIEVPQTWNGKLVMYAHGYAGNVPDLAVQTPAAGLRRHLLNLGYAWAASSYSKNYYDVRAGIEDTNALALEFTKIAAARGQTLAAPTKTFIIGHSMGGHIAAAAVEDETYATAVHKVKYQGAVPMCGVVGDTELFDYLAAAQVTAQAVGGSAATPTTSWPTVRTAVTGKLFTSFSTNPAVAHVLSADGEKWASVIENLTGGPRPMFDVGVTGYFTTVVWGTFGGDGTVDGIFNRFAADTNRFTYTIDGDAAGTTALNASAQKLTAAADFNRLRSDGLRWVPKVNGEFKVPVVTLHTLGDMYVPFSMEQIYRKRADAKGNGGWLVQRAIRGVSHCDFSVAEQTQAFDAMVAWEADPTAKPAGDDVLTPATVAAPGYGCTFTRDALEANLDAASLVAGRAALKATHACPEEARAHDTRTFAVIPAQLNATDFAAVSGGSPTTDASRRWAGVLNGAAYQIEVPQTWNGKLVMYAHGYVGTVPDLAVQTPAAGLRRHLLNLGYAWAASSYSKNWYDVRAGIEDTNALALAFTKIATARGAALAAPTKTFIIGHSMGGHIAAAAVEAETYDSAIHKVKYQGAVPMCGVTGDTELFDYLAAAQVSAQALAGQPTSPMTSFAAIQPAVIGALFTNFATSPAGTHAFTPTGQKWASVMQNLTGGARPMFNVGITGYFTTVVWGTFGSDGTVNGIFNKYAPDTNRFTYAIDGDTAGSATLNSGALKLTADAGFNRPRVDGLRWVPKVNGEFKVPVVTIHTLGDIYVPFSMEQIYRQRAVAKGNGGWLVQRAIRGVSHCDFSVAEQTEAFDAMVAWEADPVNGKPAGDDVLTAATVATPTYGCAFTRDASAGNLDTPATVTVRNQLKAAFPCP